MLKKAMKLTNAEVEEYAEGIRESLGLQDVKVWGISPKTNFALTLIAADYRMKLIGIGLEEKPVVMTNYVVGRSFEAKNHINNPPQPTMLFSSNQRLQLIHL